MNLIYVTSSLILCKCALVILYVCLCVCVAPCHVQLLYPAFFKFIYPMRGFADTHLLKFIVHLFICVHVTQLSQFGAFAAVSCTRHSVYL